MVNNKTKNPAYRRQSISRPMRIVAPIPQKGGPKIPKYMIFLKNGKHHLKRKIQKRLEICQNWRYTHRPEVSNPSGSVVSRWTKNTPKPELFEKQKNHPKRKYSKTSRNMPNLAIHPSARGLLSIGKRGFHLVL